MAIMNTNTNNKNWQGYGEKKTLIQFWECKRVQPLWKKLQRFFKKLTIKFLYDPTIGIYLKKTKTII